MKIAAIQIEITEANPFANRERLREVMHNVKEPADLYLVPELWSSGYSHAEWAQIAEDDTPKTLTWMANLAQQMSSWLGGSVVYRDDQGKLKNRFVLFNRTGQLVSHYDKIHLFTPMQEDKYLQPGNKLAVFEIEGFKVALAICYDLRFPEMFRKVALQGVDIFLVPSEWPKSRQGVLVTLAAARAIESQAYLVLANRVGVDNQGQEFAGHSAIFGPFGTVQALANESQAIVVADIDKRTIIEIRKQLPVFDHRVCGIDYDK